MTTWQERDRPHTPRENGTALVEPPAAHVSDLVDANFRNREQASCDLHGRSLAKLSQLAREELVASARQWTAAYRTVPDEPPDSRGLVFMAGHQPAMFHPGVWFKNFVLGSLAGQHRATAVNLIVDNDILTDPSVSVPGGTVTSPHTELVRFDEPGYPVPYEERRIADPERFASFGRRAADRIATLVPEPLIRQYWPLVCTRAKHTQNLGACLAQARHQLEETWGLDTLEVPQSHVCRSEAFQWFAAHLLARLPEFHAVHNEALRDYRRANRVRSTSHPVPELVQESDWLEAPFWVWTEADPRRRRLFARPVGREMAVSDRQSWEIRLPLQADGDAGRAVERLLDLQNQGVRIRSRALTTTLWARLALADLFIHGIGGAKYDRLTDQLIDRFFGLRPPRFMVVSATLLLPIDRDRTTPDDLRSLAHELRDLTYHPERHLGGANDVPSDAIAAKRRWIETTPTVENARRRCQAIRQANAAMQPWLAPLRQRLLERQTEAQRRLDAHRVLASREYAFCLHPESTLRSFLSALLHKKA